MNKQELKEKLIDTIDYYWPELDPEPPGLFVILDALGELREEIKDSHIELLDNWKDD